MKKTLIIYCSFLSFVCCKTKVSFQNCEELYDSYISLYTAGKNSEALIDLNKAINCNEDEINYRDEKVNFLINLGEYEKAIEELSFIEKVNNAYSSKNPLSSILKLRIGEKEEGEKKLRQVYNNYKNNYNKKDYVEIGYKILLDAYFVNNEHASKELSKLIEINSFQKHELEYLNYLYSLLKADNKALDIFYDLFQIKPPQ